MIPRCCHVADASAVAASESSLRRNGFELAAGVLSLGIWALMPKCPLCLAAHLALWTGLGLSFTAATYLRWSLFALSGVLLFYVVLKRICGNSARGNSSVDGPVG